MTSLLLPAIVAFLVSWYETQRQKRQNRKEWFNNIVSAATGIQRAWYKQSELTPEKQQSTIETVDKYIDRLIERKNNPHSPSKLTEAIERLDQRWIDTKDSLPASSGSLYENYENSMKRNARQVEYIADQNRPINLRERLSRYRPHPIGRLRRLWVLGFVRGHVQRFSHKGVTKLRDFFSTKEINQIEKGEKTIRVTSPFDSRFCVNSSESADRPFLSVNGFVRSLPNQHSLTLRNSFRVYPIEEDQLLKELVFAEEYELEDIETTRDIASEDLEIS